jgi:hypothetical protein
LIGRVLIGVDYHPSFQQIAFLVKETGEYSERRLNPSDGEAEKFYRDLRLRGVHVQVGMEATGYGFSEGLASVNTGARSSIEDICTVGFIDKSGGFANRPQFLAAGRFQAGLCLVETEERIGYIDHSGTFAWQSKFVEIGSFDPLHLLPPEQVHLDV